MFESFATLWTNSADDKLMILTYLSQRKQFAWNVKDYFINKNIFPVVLCWKFLHSMQRVKHELQSTLVISTSLISNNRISKWNSGPCFDIKIYQQATKYCGKEEKLLLRSNLSSFPQYFQYISNLGVKLHIYSVKGGCSINCFPQFRKSDLSKYGYLKSFTQSLRFLYNESRLYLN